MATADAARIGKLAPFQSAVHLNLLQGSILFLDEDADLAAVKPHPYITAQILRGNMVKGLLDFDVAVAMNGPGALLEIRE